MRQLPPELIADLQDTPGFDEASFRAAHAGRPVTSVRLNPEKGSGLYKDNERVRWCSNGLYLRERPVFTTDPYYHAGAYYVQEASSMFLEYLLKNIVGDRKGLRVLDLCAAPGGKSTLIASVLDSESLLVCNEVIRSRASILEENMSRWGYMNSWVVSNDPRDIGKLTGYFDIIVVDAPCSGSGLWRKDEKAIDEWSEANVQLCGERQQRILADVWPSLKQDGVLVYATCSYSPGEDEEVLDWVADTYGAVSLQPAVDDEWGIVTVTSPRHKMTGYRFFPDKVKGEGFFIAAIQKTDDAEPLRTTKPKQLNDKKIEQQASYLLSVPALSYVQADKDTWNAIRNVHEADLQILQKVVYLRKTGIAIGNPMAKEWIPAHDVALSIDANKELPGIDATKEQALHFLKREDMGITNVPKGWLMVRYNGLGLGWVKSLGNRMNNYLPKHWRIRMELSESDWL